MSGLSLNQAPPYFSVQRFFLTAPIFVMLASAVIINEAIFHHHYVFYSFLNYKLIGLLHWITLGFITMIMFGAIMQMLPVLAGVKIQRSGIFSTIIYISLTLGAFLFGLSYVFNFREFLIIGGVCITFSVGTFSTGVLFKLFSVKKGSDTIRAMRLSVASIMIVLALGLYMTAWRLTLVNGSGFNLLPLHFFWAFAGWVTLLIMGVSFQVLPMFYVSPEYPPFFRKAVPHLIFTLLVIFTIITIIEGLIPEIRELFFLNSLIRLILYFFMAIYAIITISQIQRRKRKLPDPSILFWKTAMAFLFLSAILAAVLEFYSGKYLSKFVLLTAIIFLFGFIFSVIHAMMYKIVPFLSWFHLAGKGIFNAPTMKEMLDVRRIYMHYLLHFLFLICLVTLLFYPFNKVYLFWGYLVTGILMFFSGLWFWLNLFSAILKYNKFNKP